MRKSAVSALLVATVIACALLVSMYRVSSSPNKTNTPSDVEMETKTAIISVMLAAVKKNDHVVELGTKVYLHVDGAIMEKLPRVINGLHVETYPGKSFDKRARVSYLAFTNWSRRDNIVLVSQTAHFADGNMGGCKDTYEEKQGEWVRTKADCFAAAS